MLEDSAPNNLCMSASQSTHPPAPPAWFCPGWIICCRASLQQNCQGENNDLLHLPALLEFTRSAEGKPLRKGGWTQDRHILAEKGARSRMLPKRRGRWPPWSRLSTGLSGSNETMVRGPQLWPSLLGQYAASQCGRWAPGQSG